jgi:hypothetical protein
MGRTKTDLTIWPADKNSVSFCSGGFAGGFRCVIVFSAQEVRQIGGANGGLFVT